MQIRPELSRHRPGRQPGGAEQENPREWRLRQEHKLAAARAEPVTLQLRWHVITDGSRSRVRAVWARLL
jgi:hypothetical protein